MDVHGYFLRQAISPQNAILKQSKILMFIDFELAAEQLFNVKSSTSNKCSVPEASREVASVLISGRLFCTDIVYYKLGFFI